MENLIEELLKWHEKNRSEFTSAYLDKSSLIKKILLPNADWNQAKVLEKEIDFNLNALVKIKTLLKKPPTKASQREISIIILSLKNRSEYASNQADFYPVYATLVAFSFTVMTASMAMTLKIITGAFILAIIALCVIYRFKTRLTVAYIKELINILEIYRNELLAEGKP